MRNLIFIFIIFLMSCSSSKVMTDYDSKTNFSKYKTFDFYEDNGENLNEFDVKRITVAIENEFKSSTLKQNSTPDFFIYFDAESTEKQNNNTIGIGVGSGGGNVGFGISGGIPIGGKKRIEKIIIKFIDAASNQLFWEGFLTSSIKEKRNPKERELYLQDVIQKILSTYPPEKK